MKRRSKYGRIGPKGDDSYYENPEAGELVEMFGGETWHYTSINGRSNKREGYEYVEGLPPALVYLLTKQEKWCIMLWASLNGNVSAMAVKMRCSRANVHKILKRIFSKMEKGNDNNEKRQKGHQAY